MTKPARLNLLKKTYKDWKWEKEHREWIEHSYRFDERNEWQRDVENELSKAQNEIADLEEELHSKEG